MKRLIFAVFLTSVAGQAHALSCLQPDVARTFNNLDDAEARYSVLLGKFDFTPPPPQPVSNDAQPQRATATFEGQGLAANGFGPMAPVTVVIETSCAGPWCGGFPDPDSEILAFVEQTDAGYVLTMGACGGSVFSVETAPIVEACMRGEACEAQPFH